MKVRLGTTHPIQYQVPWFRALAQRPELALEVGFAWIPDQAAQGTGFSVPFSWDVPLLDGYEWIELQRRAGAPRLSDFRGLRLRHAGRWLRGADALIVTGWNSLALVQLSIAAKRMGVRLLARGDSKRDRPRGALRFAALALWTRCFDAFLFVGDQNRRFYEALGIPARRLFPAPHFVDNERFASAAEKARPNRERVRDGWGAGPNDVVALFVGKLIAEKNVAELLRAAALARVEVPGLRLVMVGDGAMRGELERLDRELGTQARWHGFANQGALPELYAAADLLVLSSASESWGLVVNEAMACGLPAVVSDRVGCAPDLVLPGRTGEVYPSGSPRDLADRLRRLAVDGELRRSEGAAAARHVFDRHSVERAVEGTIDALRSLRIAA
jgi:glycosyltransferase involved in cell wall biosynthesis